MYYQRNKYGFIDYICIDKFEADRLVDGVMYAAKILGNKKNILANFDNDNEKVLEWMVSYAHEEGFDGEYLDRETLCYGVEFGGDKRIELLIDYILSEAEHRLAFVETFGVG